MLAATFAVEWSTCSCCRGRVLGCSVSRECCGAHAEDERATIERQLSFRFGYAEYATGVARGTQLVGGEPRRAEQHLVHGLALNAVGSDGVLASSGTRIWPSACGVVALRPSCADAQTWRPGAVQLPAGHLHEDGVSDDLWHPGEACSAGDRMRRAGRREAGARRHEDIVAAIAPPQLGRDVDAYTRVSGESSTTSRLAPAVPLAHVCGRDGEARANAHSARFRGGIPGASVPSFPRHAVPEGASVEWA